MTQARTILLWAVLLTAAAILGTSVAACQEQAGSAVPGVTPAPMMHPPADWAGVQ